MAGVLKCEDAWTKKVKNTTRTKFLVVGEAFMAYSEHLSALGSRQNK